MVGEVRTIYGVAWFGRGNQILKCFAKKEWAESYIDYLYKQTPWYKKMMYRVMSTGFIVVPLVLCEQPPTTSMVGGDQQRIGE